VLAFLSQRFIDQVHFIGGTALARTYLPDGRLSEDIDLIAIDNRKALAEQLDRELPRAFARTHGRLRVEPPLSAVADTFSVVLQAMSGLSVKVQLWSSRGRAIWPAERRQRYGDAPAAELVVPTLLAFAASKTATWADRHAARDLWDLWALNVSMPSMPRPPTCIGATDTPTNCRGTMSSKRRLLTPNGKLNLAAKPVSRSRHPKR
jgi:hypothetical protein